MTQNLILNTKVYPKFNQMQTYLKVFEFVGFSDLRETLKDFSEDSRKTFQNTLGKSSNAFYARRLSTKSSGSLPKSSAQSGTNFGYSEFGKLLRRLLENFLGTLLMYFVLDDFPRSIREVFRSLLSKVVQKNDVKWSPSLSITHNFTTKATKSLMTMYQELQCLYEPNKAWNQNLSFLDEFEKRVKEM
ncbi:hypothetical protein YC2023_089447 [Brassica napus]